MTDEKDPRRRATNWADEELGADEASPERDLHPVLGAQAAAIGGIGAGFPVGAIAGPDLLGNDDSAEGTRDGAHEGDADTDQTSVPGEGTTQRR